MTETAYKIVTETKARCSRCNYTSYNEEHLRNHVLNKACPKNAQYYTLA